MLTRGRALFQTLGAVCVLLALSFLIWKPVSIAQVSKEPGPENVDKGRSSRFSSKSHETGILDAEKLGVIDVADPLNINVPSTEGTVIPNDLGTESEPNDTLAAADALSGTEGKIRAYISPGSDVDYFSFTASAGDRIFAGVNTAATPSGSSVNSTLELRDASDIILETDLDDGSFGSTSSTIAGKILPSTGTYYLRVKENTTNTIRPYIVYFAIKSGAPVAEVEPNNTVGTASPLTVSTMVSGTVNPTADADFYSMSLAAGTTVFLALDIDPERDNTQWNGRLGFGLFGSGSPNQILVANDTSAGSATNPLSESYYFTVKDAGTYFAYVDEPAAGGGAAFTYMLNVMIIGQTVTPNCTTYTNSTPAPIVDVALSSSTITVPATSNRITDVDVFIDGTHTFMSDLDIHLRSPAGNDNGLVSDVGSATAGGTQTTMNWWLDDEAAVPVGTFGALSATMRVMPEVAYRLDWFDGENPSGVWSLDIHDDDVGDTGTLNSWSLRICETTPDPLGTVTVYSQDFEADNGGYTHSGTLDEWEYGTPATPSTTVTPAQAAFSACGSGTKCWKTDLDATYEFNSVMNLMSPAIVIPAGSISPTLSWAMKYQMETAAFDRAWVDVTNGSLTQRVWEWNGGSMTNSVGGLTAVNIGESAGWGTYTADLTAFAGTSINVTFHVDGDSSVNYPGLAIDDVRVTRFAAAASVSVTGRLMSTAGRPIGRAYVTLTEQDGAKSIAVSNSFGYYQFFNILTPQNVSISASSKRYTCPTNAFLLNGAATSNFSCTGTP